MYLQMAEQERRKAEQLYKGDARANPASHRYCKTSNYGSHSLKNVCLLMTSCTVEASTTEEPDAGKLHVRDCAGGAG